MRCNLTATATAPHSRPKGACCTLRRDLPRAMASSLSLIVGAASLVPGSLAILLRSRLPPLLTLGLAHAAASGLIVAVAASNVLAPRTTALLGKRVADGSLSPRALLLWPYHAGLRAKLAVQRRRSSEPLFDEVLPRMCVRSRVKA